MKLLAKFLKTKSSNKTSDLFLTDKRQYMLIKQGREQFKAMIKRGISVPVVLL